MQRNEKKGNFSFWLVRAENRELLRSIDLTELRKQKLAVDYSGSYSRFLGYIAEKGGNKKYKLILQRFSYCSRPKVREIRYPGISSVLKVASEDHQINTWIAKV